MAFWHNRDFIVDVSYVALAEKFTPSVFVITYGTIMVQYMLCLITYPSVIELCPDYSIDHGL